MNLLEQIVTGIEAKPPRLLVYGSEGIGKSSFGASADASVVLPTEDGLAEINCAKLPLLTKFDSVITAIGELYTEKHDFKTVVLDSADWLERLIHDELCTDYGVSSIEKVDGGYGKGYVHALSYWRKILDGLDALRNERGMAVILIAHSKIEKFLDPESIAYDRYSPRLNKHANSLICEWCDAVLFATKRFRVQTDDAGFNRQHTIAVGIGKDGGERILRTVGGPSCVAKNRYSLPAELHLSWAAFETAMKQRHS